MLTHLPLNTFQGVAAGATANVGIDAGPTYHYIVIETNQPASKILEVRFQLGSEDLVIAEGTDFAMLDKYNKKPFDDAESVLVIPFAEIEAKTQLGLEDSALVTLPGDNLNLRVKFAADAADPEISGFALTSPSRERRTRIPYIRSHYVTVNPSDKVEYNNFPLNGESYELKRLHLLGDVEQLDVHVGNRRKMEATKGEVDFIASRSDRAPQAGVFHFDPTVRGLALADAINTRQGVKFKIHTGAGANGQMRLLSESVLLLEPRQVLAA